MCGEIKMFKTAQHCSYCE